MGIFGYAPWLPLQNKTIRIQKKLFAWPLWSLSSSDSHLAESVMCLPGADYKAKTKQLGRFLPWFCSHALKAQSCLPSPVLVQNRYQLSILEGAGEKIPSNPLKQIKGWIRRLKPFPFSELLLSPSQLDEHLSDGLSSYMQTICCYTLFRSSCTLKTIYNISKEQH